MGNGVQIGENSWVGNSSQKKERNGTSTINSNIHLYNWERCDCDLPWEKEWFWNRHWDCKEEWDWSWEHHLRNVWWRPALPPLDWNLRISFRDTNSDVSTGMHIVPESNQYKIFYSDAFRSMLYEWKSLDGRR